MPSDLSTVLNFLSAIRSPFADRAIAFAAVALANRRGIRMKRRRNAVQREPGPTIVRRVLGEPLLHFLLIGLVVFALYPGDPRTEAGTGEQVIHVTPALEAGLAGQFEAVWRRPPTESELAGLIDDFVREEVYYREALALGLDRDDTVIRRRLRQKMEFLSEAGAGSLAPEEATLRSHLEAHPDRFAERGRVTFRQMFLGETDAARVLAALADGGDPDELGSRTMLPPAMDAAVRTSVDGAFGGGFFDAVAALEPGGWRGPVMSAYGAHLVFLDAYLPPSVPPLEAVRSAVEEDWRREAAEDLRETQYEALRSRYEVVVGQPE